MPPVAIVTFVVVGIPLALVAAASIPLTLAYPDRHLHLYDLEGTAGQKARLARWRAACD